MSINVSAVKPTLATPFPNIPKVWTCPITGFKVPKNPIENLQWRADILEEADEDKGLQADLFAASAQSVLFWINAFCWTFRIQEVDKDGKVVPAIDQHLPYVTWDIQDKHILEIENSINSGTSLLTDKSRDMGASWNHIAAIHHQWLFVDDSLFLEISRVESDVDGSDNPRCLFVKHDYLNKWLPPWMRPHGVLPGEKYRTRMHIVNPVNGSRIDGESSNKAAGSGDRRKAVLLDEFAKQENSAKIRSSLRDVSPCLLPNSTPFGAGTTYSNWRQSGQIKVFMLPWYEHPEKGRNRYVVQDDGTGKWKIRSPWYDLEDEKRSPQEMAQEIDCDHLGSGSTFFEGYIIDQHKRMFARNEIRCGSIDFVKGTSTDAIPDILARKQHLKVMHAPNGNWRWWNAPQQGRRGGGLDQNKTYIVGCDISKGQGASNSVISVLCKETMEKVGEFACANTPPYDLARIAVAACLWVGGRGGLPLLVWEANGPGWDFGRQVVQVYRYPKYYVDRAVGTVTEKKGKRYGWHSSREKKELLLGAYRRALAKGGYINHSAEALDEATEYIYYPDGGLGPAQLREESADARKTHGDRVIADALTMLGAGEVRSHVPAAPSAPEGSIGWRWQQAKRETKQRHKEEPLKFDFRTGS